MTPVVRINEVSTEDLDGSDLRPRAQIRIEYDIGDTDLGAEPRVYASRLYAAASETTQQIAQRVYDEANRFFATEVRAEELSGFVGDIRPVPPPA